MPIEEEVYYSVGQQRISYVLKYFNRGADNSLARPGRKQATATEDFDVHVFYLLS